MMWRKSATKSTITLRPSVSLENPPAGDLVEEGFKGLLQRQLKVLSKVQQKLVFSD